MIYFFFDKEKMEHEKDLERWWMHLTKPSMVSTLKEHLYFFLLLGFLCSNPEKAEFIEQYWLVGILGQAWVCELCT